MKKTLALILVLVMVAFAFASCGKKKSNETSPATDAATTPATTPATDAKTNAATDAKTNAATDAKTDAATTPATDAATTPATDAATDAATTPAATDAATDAATTPATDAATTPATDAATTPATDAATTPATDAATDPATDPAETDVATDPAETDPATDPAETDPATGCVHEWDEGEENYVIDAEPDCFTEGSKSIHCKKCHEPVPETVVVLPKQHVPEDEYEIETEPTCTDPGLKVLYCAECGEELESVEIDPDPDAHQIDEWEIVDATIFADGSKHGVCTLCGEELDEVIEETYNEWKYTTDSAEEHNIKVNPSTLRGEGHYYPDGDNLYGQDYIVEFSFLWNDTLQNLSKKNAAGEDNKLHQVLCGEMHSKAFFWMALKDGAKGADSEIRGAFEYTDCMQTVEYGPASMSLNASGKITGGVYGNFPNIGGADQANPEWGWHRLAFVYHQELVNEDEMKEDTEPGATPPEYRIEYSCYIDGVLIFTHSNRADANFHASQAVQPDNLLFTAQSDGEGGVIYTDTETNTFTPVRIKPVRTDEGDAYAVIADFKAHVEPAADDPAFAQNVEKVATPDDNVYTTEDEVEIPAKIWYQLKAD